jgi:hypothetical protein
VAVHSGWTERTRLEAVSQHAARVFVRDHAQYRIDMLVPLKEALLWQNHLNANSR